MNLFAHAVLAGDEPLHLASGIVADRIKGVPGHEPFCLLPEPVRQGVIQHRAIDSYTDTHPLMEQARGFFTSPSRRVAGILLDLYGDWLLHSQWGRWRTDSHAEVLGRARLALHTSEIHLPLAAADWARFILQFDLLTACADWTGLVDIAMRLGRRIGKQAAFAEGLVVMKKQSPQFNGLYLEFMDDLFKNQSLSHSAR